MCLPSGMTSSRVVTSSPPVSWTGKRCGPSRRHTWALPVTDHVKNILVPSRVTAPAPGERTSSIDWTRRRTSGGRGGGAYLAAISGVTPPAFWSLTGGAAPRWGEDVQALTTSATNASSPSRTTPGL